MIKLNNFRGDLSSISTKKEALVLKNCTHAAKYHKMTVSGSDLRSPSHQLRSSFLVAC